MYVAVAFRTQVVGFAEGIKGKLSIRLILPKTFRMKLKPSHSSFLECALKTPYKRSQHAQSRPFNPGGLVLASSPAPVASRSCAP